MKIKILPSVRPLIVFKHEITDGEISFKVERNDITDEMFKKWIVVLTKNERLEEDGEYELFLAKSGFSIDIVEENYKNIIRMGFITPMNDREKPGGFIIINISVDEFLSTLKNFMDSSDYDYYIVEKGNVKVLGYQKNALSVSPVKTSPIKPSPKSPVKSSPVRPAHVSPVKVSPVKPSPVSPVKPVAKPMIKFIKPAAKPVAKTIVKPMSR